MLLATRRIPSVCILYHKKGGFVKYLRVKLGVLGLNILL